MAKGERRRRFDSKIVILIAIVALFLFFWYQKRQEEQETAREVRTPVQVVSAEHGNLDQEYSINGYVQSETTVTVRPKISGTLTDMHVSVGDAVDKDQVIAEIDSEFYELTMSQAEASYLAAQSTYQRTKQMYEANATSKQDYDQAKSRYEAAKSQYELAKLRYTYTKIKAPIEGSILEKHTSIGSLVASDVPIVTIADLADLTITVGIPEKYYARFLEQREDLSISARLPALENKTFEATLETISPYIASETKTFEVTCRLSGQISSVRPGMFVCLTFVLGSRKNVYSLPYKTLVAGNYLWYVDGENTAHRIQFSPTFHTSDRFIIPDKYSDYRFIIEGQHFLREGQKVNVLHENS
jgi:membrane fusion protein (multidrug efflux system)